MPINIQNDPLVTDDLAAYAGAWVAIRDGRVVASALDPVELRHNPAVHDHDVVMPVPPDGGATLIV